MARLVALLCCCLALPVWTAERISVRADEWFPVNGRPDAARPGFAIELLAQIFVAPEYELDYQLLGWQRALELVNTGATDCVIGAYKSEAPGLLFPRYPLAHDSNAFYVRTDSDWRYRGLDSIGRRAIAVIGEYDYGVELDRWIATRPPNLHIAHGREPLRQNLRMLLAGRVDAVLESELVMSATLADLGLSSQIINAGGVNGRMPFYFACRRGERGAAIIAHFEQGWQLLAQDGRLAAIYQRYQLVPPD